METIRVGLLGCGVVGGATLRILREHADELAFRAGARLEVVKVAVRDPQKRRDVPLPDGVLTGDPHEVTTDPSIHIVVEAMGGLDPATDLILEAIGSGKHVVTANKELLSTVGGEVLSAAGVSGVDILFEAAVGGGIPIIRPLRESLAGDRVRRVMGIVNGTTNFILTRMSELGESFEEALAEADRLGYTEADPSADVEGYDAAAKLAILATLAFGSTVLAVDIHREGITRVTPADIAAAHELGYEVKLLAVAEESEGMIAVRVHPAMLPKTHPLATVRDVFNAIFVEGENVGELMFQGRGAGGAPTASAVASDVVEIARNIVSGGRSPTSAGYARRAEVRPPAESPVRYYMVLSVLDQPGVLAAVASTFARHDISISSVRQEGSGDQATLVLITHLASEGGHQATFEELQSLDVVKEIASKMRVEGTSEA
ncbi:MAG TPA: homoserine dehydrogenase [Actinomycetota bacterium]|nr:homoserine dehydrogenase [Actinomycetota bacterium]